MSDSIGKLHRDIIPGNDGMANEDNVTCFWYAWKMAEFELETIF